MNKTAPTDVRGLLFTNQLWETIAFVAKAAFLVFLTPIMLRQWGSYGYGEFALASSGFVLLSAALDGGIRPQLRLALCQSLVAGDGKTYRSRFCAAIVSFLLAAGAVLVVMGVIYLLPGTGALLGLNVSQYQLAFVTTGMTALVLLSGLMVEPLAAHGQMAMFKLAHAAGSLLAILAVYCSLRCGLGITAVVVGWLASLALANLVLFAGSRLRTECLWTGLCDVRLSDIRTTFHNGWSFFAINVTWLAKTHGLTLIVSQMSGAAAGGLFFILLRISEVIGTLCAVSSDAVIAALARAKTGGERKEAFVEAYRYVAILSSHVALIVLLLMPAFLRVWLGSAVQVSVITLCAVALFGVAGAFNRIVTGVATGLALVERARRCAIWEALATILGVAVTQLFFGLNVAFICAALAAACLLPVARAIASRIDQTGARTWLQPLRQIGLFFCALALLATLAIALGNNVLLYAVAIVVGGCAALQIFRLPALTATPALPHLPGLIVAE